MADAQARGPDTTPDDGDEFLLRTYEAEALMIEHAPDSLRAEVYLALTMDTDSEDPRTHVASYGEAVKAMNDLIRSDCDPALVWDELSEP
jgi:hypothetical protein